MAPNVRPEKIHIYWKYPHRAKISIFFRNLQKYQFQMKIQYISMIDKIYTFSIHIHSL